jgi:PIN domain nuclease of toxin-antitoxin system
MKLLLDTHTFLWLDSCPEKLSRTALAACEDPANQLYLSVVSAWEIQIKRQIGRLQLDVPLAQMIQAQQSANDLRILAVELHHADEGRRGPQRGTRPRAETPAYAQSCQTERAPSTGRAEGRWPAQVCRAALANAGRY